MEFDLNAKIPSKAELEGYAAKCLQFGDALRARFCIGE